MTALLVLHIGAAVAAPLVSRRSGRWALPLAAVAPFATLVWALWALPRMLRDETLTESWSWAADLGLVVNLRLDAMSLLMVLLISGVGVLIFAYSAWYMPAGPSRNRFAALLVGFAGSMLGVVLADNLLVLYVFWELTSVTSFLLIGFEDDKPEARASALHALLVTAAGGLAMLGGFVLLGQAAGTYELSALLADPPGGTAAGVGLALVLLGAVTKSAQFPFHAWLPGAMAAPTPVSAYLHSATMVKAGVYLIARFGPAMAAVHGFWRPTVVTIGLVTMLVGGYRALRQHDLKLLMADSTISQLGLMTALAGAGRAGLTFAAGAVILAHGLFKAVLFMVVGIVDHQTHTRDLRQLSGQWRRLPVTFVVAAVAIASMAGLPPMMGYAAKEAAFEGLLDEPENLAMAVAVVVGSMLTVAYCGRFLWGAFATKADAGTVPRSEEATEVAWSVLAPPALLGLLTVGMGLVPAVPGRLVSAAASALDARAEGTLYLWHGLGPALVASAISIAGGLVLFRYRRRVEATQRRLSRGWSATGAYHATLNGLNRTADRLTGIVQNGSLPVYLGVILLTLLVLPGAALALAAERPDGAVFVDSPIQVAVAALVMGAAIGTTMVRRRFAAVLFLGGVGYGTAVLFVIQGAPDLALTQLLIETLVLVVFVLVLRHLPERFERRPWRLGHVFRVAVSAGLGVFVAVFAVVASNARLDDPVSQAHLERSLPEGGGRNVVNVILVDFRGLDTLGEITVLVVAAMGIVSLVVARRGEAR